MPYISTSTDVNRSPMRILILQMTYMLVYIQGGRIGKGHLHSFDLNLHLFTYISQSKYRGPNYVNFIFYVTRFTFYNVLNRVSVIRNIHMPQLDIDMSSAQSITVVEIGK